MPERQSLDPRKAFHRASMGLGLNASANAPEPVETRVLGASSIPQLILGLQPRSGEPPRAGEAENRAEPLSTPCDRLCGDIGDLQADDRSPGFGHAGGVNVGMDGVPAFGGTVGCVLGGALGVGAGARTSAPVCTGGAGAACVVNEGDDETSTSTSIGTHGRLEEVMGGWRGVPLAKLNPPTASHPRLTPPRAMPLVPEGPLSLCRCHKR